MSSHSQTVVLPVEPTREMLSALMGNPLVLAASYEMAGRAAYAAMLKAAPQQAGPSDDAIAPPQFIMSGKARRRIAALQKRADHLAARIADSALKDLSFDKQELSALTWAIQLLNAAPQGNISARSSEKSPVESIARASSEAGADDARDAARYRWLRQGDRDGPRTRQMQYHHMEHLDEAIDAAIASDATRRRNEMTINSQGEWANAIEDAEQVMLRWGHGQVRRVPDEIAEAIVAALRAPVSELTQSEPPHGLLVSIALRLDHGLFLRQDMIGETEEQHQRRIEVALSDARKAWEECTGHGFYRPEREAEYANHLGLDKQQSERPESPR